MSEPINLSAERDRRELERHHTSRLIPRGLTVVVLDELGTEAFRLPCGPNDGEVAEFQMAVCPGAAERAAVAAALRDALSVMDQVVALTPAT